MEVLLPIHRVPASLQAFASPISGSLVLVLQLLTAAVITQSVLSVGHIRRELVNLLLPQRHSLEPIWKGNTGPDNS